jgi:hypothetical protein
MIELYAHRMVDTLLVFGRGTKPRGMTVPNFDFMRHHSRLARQWLAVSTTLALGGAEP